MDLEQNYFEYIIQLSLSILAVSAAFFFDPSNLASTGALLLIPVLFGYTAYVSSEEFRMSSLASLITLFFIPVTPALAVAAGVIAAGNPLTSLFASGDSFKDYYSATTLPLLFTGVMLGAGIFLAANVQPDLQQTIVQNTADYTGNYSEEVIQETGLIEQQKDIQTQIVEETSVASINATQAIVVSSMSDSLSRSQAEEMNQAFSDARSAIPGELSSRGEQEVDASSKIADRLSSTVSRLLKSNLIVLIPFTAFLMYGLHPVIGLMTAISAKSFAVGRRKLLEQEN